MEIFFFIIFIINLITFFIVRTLSVKKTEEKAFWKTAKKVKKYFLFGLLFGFILLFFFLEDVFRGSRSFLTGIYGILFIILLCFSLIHALHERQRIQGAIKRRLKRNQ